MLNCYGIHGQRLEVTVLGCSKLRDKAPMFFKQNSYVSFTYGGDNYRTRTCTNGGTSPSFQDKFVLTLHEGQPKSLKFSVWRSKMVEDGFIGSTEVDLRKVLSDGFDDSTWPLLDNTGRHSGEVRLILRYANASSQKPSTSHSPSTPLYAALDIPPGLQYPAPPPATAPYAPSASAPPYSPSSTYPSSYTYHEYPTNAAPCPPNPSKNHMPSAPPYPASDLPSFLQHSTPAPPPAAAPYAPPCSPSSTYPASSTYHTYPTNPAPYRPNPNGIPSANHYPMFEGLSAYPPQPYSSTSPGPSSAYPHPHIPPSAYPPHAPAWGFPCYPPESSPSQGSPDYTAGSACSDHHLFMFYVLLVLLFTCLVHVKAVVCVSGE